VDADAFMIKRTCAIKDLLPGMILQQEVRTSTGMLLVNKGQEATLQLILKLKDVLAVGSVTDGVLVAIPKSPEMKLGSSPAK
jgi:hypothetical protein